MDSDWFGSVPKLGPVYIHEKPGWPKLFWDETEVSAQLPEVYTIRGELFGALEVLGFEIQQESILESLIQDVTKSSEIEGRYFDQKLVRSSVARRLGMDFEGLPKTDRDVEGIVAMTIDAVQNYRLKLTKKRLVGWHAALFPTAFSGFTKITVGGFRRDETGPMQVVSGSIGKEVVHYEAPAASRLNDEMKFFLNWFETFKIEPILKAAIAHLMFETIHPFDDGNGRIGRAVMDMALARADRSGNRPYSMSNEIFLRKNDYYHILERTQKGNLDATDWILWFIDCLKAAINSSKNSLSGVKQKADFWDRRKNVEINERQRKVLNLLLDGYDGKLRTNKYAAIAKCSSDTALRDITDLIAKGLLIKEESGGRSTSYRLIETRLGNP